MKGKIDQNGNLIAFGDYPDGVNLPEHINGGNYFQYRLVDKDWQVIEITPERKQETAKQILSNAYQEIANIIDLTIDEAYDFVKDDLVDKGKVDAAAETGEIVVKP